MIKNLLGRIRKMAVEPETGTASLKGEAEAELRDAQERIRHELGMEESAATGPAAGSPMG